MKKLVFLALLLSGLTVSAQSSNWFTDYKEAFTKANSLEQKVVTIVFNSTNIESSELLNKNVFQSEEFQRLSANFILLKLDTSADDYNKRIGKHYTGSSQIPALALVAGNGNRIGNSLLKIDSESIQEFLSFVQSQTN